MNETKLKAWLGRYQEAWESRDPDAAAALFTEDARYYETPFLAPAKGPEGIRDYWANATRNQSHVTFSYEVVCVSGNVGIARWWAAFTRTRFGVTARLDGVFLLRFSDEGLCRELREWWHMEEAEPQDV